MTLSDAAAVTLCERCCDECSTPDLRFVSSLVDVRVIFHSRWLLRTEVCSGHTLGQFGSVACRGQGHMTHICLLLNPPRAGANRAGWLLTAFGNKSRGNPQLLEMEAACCSSWSGLSPRAPLGLTRNVSQAFELPCREFSGSQVGQLRGRRPGDKPAGFLSLQNCGFHY